MTDPAKLHIIQDNVEELFLPYYIKYSAENPEGGLGPAFFAAEQERKQ